MQPTTQQNNEAPNAGTFKASEVSSESSSSYPTNGAGVKQNRKPVMELRAINNDDITLVGHYDDEASFRKYAQLLNEKGWHIYSPINPIKPSGTRDGEKYEIVVNNDRVPGRSLSASAECIAEIRWLPYDIDPTRLSPDGEKLSGKIPSTDNELRWAKAVADKVVAFWREQGAEPRVITSGNGYYVLVPVRIALSDAGAIKHVITVHTEKFDTPGAHIDTKVGDPSRVFRVPGYVNCKGGATAERPNRRVELIQEGSRTRELTKEDLLRIVPEATQHGTRTPDAKKVEDGVAWVESFLEHSQIAHDEREAHDGGYRYKLEPTQGYCPRHEDHTSDDKDGAQAVLVLCDGSFGFSCMHSHCDGSHGEPKVSWREFRAFTDDRNVREGRGRFKWDGGPQVAFGGANTGKPESARPETSAVAELKYPLHVWDGTLYGEYAGICTQGSFIPPEYFVESLKTLVGAVVGENLFIANINGGIPRFYTILIGLPSAGKNTAIEWTTSIFNGRASTANSIPYEENIPSRLLHYPQDNPDPTLGVCRAKISSASGLAKFLPSVDGRSKHISQKRLILVYPELSELLEKLGIDGSGAATMSALCDLYDGTEFTVPALADQKPFGGTLSMSVLAGIQPERWNDLGSGKGVEHSGIHSRWNLVPSEETRTVAYLTTPKLADFRLRLRSKIPSKLYVVIAGEEAKREMADWHSSLFKRVQGIDSWVTARLNIIAWRNALHHAWLFDKKIIDAESARAGIELADYQLVARQRYAPLVGDDRLAKSMDKIRRFLQQRSGPVCMRDLKLGVNYRRMGSQFELALARLIQVGDAAMDASKQVAACRE
jgi:hypothetical protein